MNFEINQGNYSLVFVLFSIFFFFVFIVNFKNSFVHNQIFNFQIFDRALYNENNVFMSVQILEDS